MNNPIKPGALVLVTGINGHVASCTALRLLEKGYAVRGTVRTLARGSYIKESGAFTQYAAFGKFNIVEVPDIAKDGVFDTVLQGVDAVVHMASPVTMGAKMPEEQYIPAVNGTLSILRSAHAIPTVKRFLYLGSIGSAVMTAKDPTREVITRDDWNVVTDQAVKNLDDPFIGFHIYIGSKLAAERAAWAFVEQEKPHFDFTAILGAMVFGPVYKAVHGPPRQDVSLGQLYDTFADPPRVDGVSPVVSTVWVHAFDIADLFVASLTSSKTPSKRLLAVAGRFSWAQVTDTLREAYPGRKYVPEKADAPCMNYPGANKIEFDTALEKELLGGHWRGMEDAVVSCARDLMEKEHLGWDPASGSLN